MQKRLNLQKKIIILQYITNSYNTNEHVYIFMQMKRILKEKRNNLEYKWNFLWQSKNNKIQIQVIEFK